MLRPSVQQELEESIAAEPERHPRIPGTSGFRKARWRRSGGGKSGGVRVIYYFMVRPDVIFLADIYAKNEKENFDPCGKKPTSKNRLGNPTRVRRLRLGGRLKLHLGVACLIL